MILHHHICANYGRDNRKNIQQLTVTTASMVSVLLFVPIPILKADIPLSRIRKGTARPQIYLSIAGYTLQDSGISSSSFCEALLCLPTLYCDPKLLCFEVFWYWFMSAFSRDHVVTFLFTNFATCTVRAGTLLVPVSVLITTWGSVRHFYTAIFTAVGKAKPGKP